MTQVKVTELDALTTAETSDVLLIIDDPGGTPISKKITKANFVKDLTIPTPGAIGGTTPAAGAFTTLSASGLISADGGQIAFPATQDPSSDPKTLDDYEEGTWTPEILFSNDEGDDPTYAANGQQGAYVKIGQFVFVSGRISITNNGSSTGDFRINGLPFVAGTGNYYYSGGSIAAMSGITFANQIFVGTSPANSYLVVREVTEAGALSSLTNSDVADAALISFSCAYRAAS